MGAKGLIIVALVGVMVLAFGQAMPAEKLKVGTPSKADPGDFLRFRAAEEKGFWKEAGLEVEWIPFESQGVLSRSVAAGSILVGAGPTIWVVPATARGVPMKVVADLKQYLGFGLWVRPDSPIKEPKDLKGTRIGVTNFGAGGHAFAQVVVKQLGLKDQVKFAAAGGITTLIGGVQAGVLDSLVLAEATMVKVKWEGKARKILDVTDYLPKQWIEKVAFARKDFIQKEPETARRIVKAMVAATNFVDQNRSWAIAALTKEFGFAPHAAEEAYRFLNFKTDGKIERQAVENVVNFLLEYGLLRKGEAPVVDELFTNEFLG